MTFLKGLYLPNRFFYAAASLILIMILSYAFPFLMAVAQAGGVLLVLIFSVDVLLLYNKNVRIILEREVPGVLSLGDSNLVRLSAASKSSQKLWIQLVDELPEQFQARDFRIYFELSPNESKELSYPLRPLSRGVNIISAKSICTYRPALALQQERLHTRWTKWFRSIHPSSRCGSMN